MKDIKMKTAITAITVMSVFMLAGCGSNGGAGALNENTDASAAVQQQEQQNVQTPAQPQDTQTTTAGDIGSDKVKAIVLAKVPGATENDIYELEKDYDNGRVEYEGSIYYSGYEYEFEVDGTTGNLLKWEIDD